MFLTFPSVIVPTYLQVSKEDNSNLWNDRYAHINFKGLGTNVKKDNVKGLLTLKYVYEKCSDCVVRK